MFLEQEETLKKTLRRRLKQRRLQVRESNHARDQFVEAKNCIWSVLHLTIRRNMHEQKN